MKKIYNSILTLSLLATTFTVTSCIKETVPTSSATEEQIKSSDRSLSALLWGMPASLNTEDADNAHYRFGYGALMKVRDVMTGDYTTASNSYNHFSSWARNVNQGESYAIGQYLWNVSYEFVHSANLMLNAVPDVESASDEVKGYVGAAYAFRAMEYLDLARMYEFLPNDKTEAVNKDGNNVQNLTVPIVTEKTTEAEARNNPRATRAEMAKFIEDDLNNAEKYIEYLSETNKTLPHLDCVYGLKARLYMWLEDYPKAQEYAKKAIEASSLTRPMNEDEMLNTSKGFNDISRWMWGGQLVKENDAVQTGIVNWVSWMSNETSFGYNAYGPRIRIDAAMYSRISNTDIRKNLWSPGSFAQAKAWYKYYCVGIGDCLNNDGSINAAKDEVRYRAWNAYTSIKFRPNLGKYNDVQIGGASAYPIMRLEEMYFIMIEALAHQNANLGKQLLESFMQNYRDPNYTCLVTNQDDVIEEIVFQKRVELWGEGQSFFDIKRLNYSVTRGYKGTNHVNGQRYNTEGRPAWMNLVIVQTEQNNNEAVMGYNNPDPTGKYTNWSE